MDPDLETGYLLAVAAAAVWSPRPLVAMLKEFGSARALVEFAKAPMRAAPASCEPLGAQALARIAAIDDATALAALADVGRGEHRFITSANSGYPRRLLELCDPPPALYYEGDLVSLEQRVVAVVGSRAATPYGRSMAAQLVRGFAAYGTTVISGLARGIDAAAHRAAIAHGVPTVAVIGSGLQSLYPSYHRELAREIVAHGGAMLSEFPPAMTARQHHFPMRNRLVAALADATIVVEAGAQSGALITARLAADLGRYVFAVPGDVGRSASEGTNGLIKDGVSLTTGAEDIAGVLGWKPHMTALPEPQASENNAGNSGDKLMAALRAAPKGVDELCSATGLEAATVSAQLMLLEIEGLVERTAGGVYRTT